MGMVARRGGALRRLDFGDWPTAVTGTGGARAGLRLAAPADMSGPGKYRVLAERRRRAQIRARHVLDQQDGGVCASLPGHVGTRHEQEEVR